MTGLDLAFTSIESLNFPETSPQLLELSLRLANAPAFSNPLNLLKLGNNWLIDWLDRLIHWLDLVTLLVDVCRCLLWAVVPGFLVFSFWKFMQVWSAIFYKATWPPGLCHPFWTQHGKPKKQRWWDPGELDWFPASLDQTMQKHGNFCWFAFNSGLFGLVSYDDPLWFNQWLAFCVMLGKGTLLESLGGKTRIVNSCAHPHYLEDHHS